MAEMKIEICMNGWSVEEDMRKTVVFTHITELMRFVQWRLLKQAEWQVLPEDYDTERVDYK